MIPEDSNLWLVRYGQKELSVRILKPFSLKYIQTHKKDCSKKEKKEKARPKNKQANKQETNS